MGYARIAIFLASAVSLVAASPAQAEIKSVFDGAVECETREDGSRFCGGPDTLVETFDGQLIDVNVALPPKPAGRPDGRFPLVMHFHGYGGSELGEEQLSRWTEQGYAAFSMSDRGFGPCGAKPVPPARCASGGWVRLMDTRYEVRDAQVFSGMLVDEGIAKKANIAAAGGSYGGGLSMALAALKNRTMLEDGTLVPWESPEGRRISLAAAIPEIPWTDLANSLLPNGRTLDYVADAPYLGPDGEAPIGVMKETFVSGFYASGLASGFYAPPLVDPDADLQTWFARINAGEPYDDPEVQDIVDEVTAHHSSYYINHSIRPAPLLISNGWTDDIFPADEAIRFYNRTRTQYRKADVSLFFLDYGHQRGQNKDADIAVLHRRQDAFLAHHLKGADEPRGGVTTLTQACGEKEPSAGPFRARSWSRIARGEIRGKFRPAQTIAPSVPGDAERGQAYDPISGGGACATAPGSDQPGAASYRLDPAPARGFTLMGSPTVVARITSSSPTSQVAARLLDVDEGGDATLVARGTYRPDASGKQVFQLHPNGYEFAEGHVAKLELLPVDAPYSRASNGQAPVTVERLKLRLPVVAKPGKRRESLVRRPARKFVPDGYELARGYRR